MARCEDFPCCGHGEGGCPNSDGTFNCCTCGSKLPKNSRSSMCKACLRSAANFDEDLTGQDYEAAFQY